MALYHNLTSKSYTFITLDEARRALEKADNGYIEFLHDKVLQVNLGENVKVLKTTIFNRGYGENAAEKVMKELREKTKN